MGRLPSTVRSCLKGIYRFGRNTLQKYWWKTFTTWKKATGRDIESVRQYEDYDDYVRHQKEKTTDPERIRKWKEDEWNWKLTGFKEIFERNGEYVLSGSRALCLGSRTGQEVKALRDKGLDAIGVDLVSFPPYTIKGDVHYLQFEDESFDLVFTNIFDHVLDSAQFCAEIERVLKSGGIVMLHLMLGYQGDEYTETIVHDSKPVKERFANMVVLEDRQIENIFDEMNWELVLRKG